MKNDNMKVNIRHLYHGTSSNPPENIYGSDDGFNINYSNAGMWGKANYFAVNASYSHTYKHTVSDGKFQMFYAKVILGEPKTMRPDGTLREPPMKEDSTRVRHDSVKGKTGGSDVFMVYSNKKAYPEYLITYKM